MGQTKVRQCRRLTAEKLPHGPLGALGVWVVVIHDKLRVIGGQDEPAHAKRPDAIGGNGAGAVKLRDGHRDRRSGSDMGVSVGRAVWGEGVRNALAIRAAVRPFL